MFQEIVCVCINGKTMYIQNDVTLCFHKVLSCCNMNLNSFVMWIQMQGNIKKNKNKLLSQN